MKIEPRNKRRKVDLVKLDTSIYQDLMKDSRHKLDTSRSIELYDFRIFISKFRLMMTWIARISFTKPPTHIKALF